MKLAPTLLTLSLLGLAHTGHAQTLIPLDSRPATSTLAADIAAVDGAAVKVPPAELLGTAKEGADYGKLLAWLKAQPAQGPLVVSLDALGYGGLVQSRKSPLSVAEVLARLEPLRERAKSQPIYAFITLPRMPDATNRERNLAVARTMIQWAKDGTFTELHVTWDDALPTSPAPKEGAELAKTAPDNVLVYPGADEVLSTLAARALVPDPTDLNVVYSDPATQNAVTKYDGISLSQSVALHAQAVGMSASTDSAAPLTLYVYNGGDTRKAALAVSALLRDAARHNHWVAVADVNSVNMGNSKFWSDLSTLRYTPALASLAAWGTPGNNIGTALAHAKMVLAGADPKRQDALLAREYANDVIYSAILRPELRKALPEAQLPQTPPAKAQQVLDKLSQNLFPLRLGDTYTLQDPKLPWKRSFEWQFDLQPVK